MKSNPITKEILERLNSNQEAMKHKTNVMKTLGDQIIDILGDSKEIERTMEEGMKFKVTIKSKLKTPSKFP